MRYRTLYCALCYKTEKCTVCTLFSVHGTDVRCCRHLFSLNKWQYHDEYIIVIVALVVLVLVYAAETWTLLAVDVRTLEAFHMRCQHQILGIRWYDYIWKDEVAFRTGLPPIMDRILNRRCALFSHIACLPECVPANQALLCHVDASLGQPPQHTWGRTPGRPRNSWLEQIRQDSGSTPADL